MSTQAQPDENEAEQLLIEAAQRDPRRFAELFERHAHRVYAFIARRVRERSEVEDLTSEVFHLALKNLKRYEYRGAPFTAWLFKIASNAIAQHGRDHARRKEAPLDDAPEPVTDEDAERRAVLFDLLRTLPPDQQKVIRLRYAEQKSLREIAGEMDRSEAAVKQLHYRALENLRQHMEGRHAR
ncbi:MAG: RNA polymerase sigma factor [Terriglobales bacterium]